LTRSGEIGEVVLPFSGSIFVFFLVFFIVVFVLVEVLSGLEF
jgi:hypothetical protein